MQTTDTRYNNEWYVAYFGVGSTTGCVTTITAVYVDISPSICNQWAIGSICLTIKLGQLFPQNCYIRKNFIQNNYALLKPGNYVLKPYESKLYERWFIYEGVSRNSILLGTSNGGGTIITTCSLVNNDILVNFGEVSEAKDSERFNIEFFGCTNQADSRQFNDTVSLSFRSERIRADGTALQNNICANCAKGLQIALKDGAGKPIDLWKRYKLSGNGASTVTPIELVYGFIAELQSNPNEKLAGGKIDSQLVFETIVE